MLNLHTARSSAEDAAFIAQLLCSMSRQGCAWIAKRKRIQMKVSDAFRKAFNGEEVSPQTAEVKADGVKKILLITQDGCHGCDMAQEYLKEEIDNGDIEVCPLSDGRCSGIANELHLRETPSIVSVDGEGVHHKCDIRTEGDDFLFECPVTEGGDGKPKKAVEKKPPAKHGKLALSCLSPEVKHQLGFFLQTQPNLAPEALALVGGLPECSPAEDGMPTPVGFSEVKKSGGAATKPSSGRSAFMRECLSGSTGEPQPLRMSRCSREWREMTDKEKKKYT